MNKIIPLLAILGGGYLLLKSKNNPPKNETTPTPIDIPTFNPTPLELESQTNYSSGQSSNVGSIVVDFEQIGWNTWRGKEWSSWFLDFSKNYENTYDAFQDAFDVWRNPLNPKRNFFLDVKQFVLGLAIAQSIKTELPRNVVGQFNITYNSTPVYDTWYNWWYGVPAWSCSEWKQWYFEMKNFYGEADARQRWNSAAQNSENDVFGGEFHGCLSDCDFYKFQIQNNLWRPSLPLTGIITWTTCDVGQVVTNATNTVVNASQGIANTAKVASYLLPVLAVVGTYFIYKKYLKNGKK